MTYALLKTQAYVKTVRKDTYYLPQGNVLLTINTTVYNRTLIQQFNANPVPRNTTLNNSITKVSVASVKPQILTVYLVSLHLQNSAQNVCKNIIL